jgi:hypothetical protein
MEDIRKGVCPLCRHNEIVETAPHPDVTESGGQRPLAVTYEQRSGIDDWRRPIGRQMTYFCRRCGYTQWFVQSPETVPIREGQSRVIKGPGADGPYR